MKKRIYLKDWLKLKPYVKQTTTDSYYLKICNNVKNTITTNRQSLILHAYLDKEDVDLLACFLTSYFEDIISETNIWNSFTKVHKRLYKKYIPFYNLDEYYVEEINPQDVSFLIWYFINTVHEDEIFSPFSGHIAETAEKVMDVFDEAWDFAPKNEYLKSFYQINENEWSFYVARNLIDTILFKTYLFYPDTSLKLKYMQLEILEDNRENENVLMYLNENRDNTLHENHTRLLALRGKEWASEILGDNHPLSKFFLNISNRIRGFFMYKGQDHDDIFIEHIASSKKFKLTKKSFDHSDTLKAVDEILFMSIVQWKNEWWFSGVFFKQSFNPDLVLDEKKSLESRMAVDFLDHPTKETYELLNNQLKAFKDFNDGSQIAFLSSDKIESFVKNYVEYFNHSLNLTVEEKKKAKQEFRKDGFFGKGEKHSDYSKVAETGLVFFNPKRGVEITLDVNNAFPQPNNPFFDIEHSKEDLIFLLTSDEMSTELALFCIENGKSNLPFFNDGIGKFFLKDIDFLLRFWKQNNYHSIPSITFIGQKEK